MILDRKFYSYINGELVEGNSREEVVVCPGTEEEVVKIKLVSPEQVNEAFEAAREAFPYWSTLPLEEREQWALKLSDAIWAKEEEFFQLLMLETGKVKAHIDFEPGQIVRYLKFFMEQAKCNHDETIRDITGGKGAFLAVREPLGVVSASLAWNFPLHNMATKLGPILASGCTAVIKPSQRTPLSAMLLGEILKEIDFPKGVINLVIGDSREIGETLCNSKIPAMISLIGSTPGGLKMISDSVTSVKRFSMELGGDAPTIITESADIEKAAKDTMTFKISDAGQCCVAPQRAIIHEKVYDKFIEACIKECEAAVCGTMEEDANMDPLINKETLLRMEALVEDAKAKGAKIIWGGRRPEYKSKGYYYLPTIISESNKDCRVMKEEIFGPILVVMKYTDLNEAIKMANDTEYGLSSYVWGRDMNEISQVVKGLEFGVVNVNGPGTGAHLPHGGCKNSGIGKDGSRYSLDEYYYIKGVRIALDK